MIQPMSTVAEAPAPPAPDVIATPLYRWTLGLAAGLLQSAVYFGVGHLQLNRSTELLRTRLDDAIPFWPWTSWCYLPFYAGVFIIAIGGFRRRALFNRGLVAVAVLIAVGAMGHIFVGAEYPRPVLQPPYPDISSWFMAAVWRIDPPGNVFPSLHVAHTTMLSLILIRDRPRLGIVALVMATMLALSTLTTKQHFIADVLAGYLLAFLGRYFVLRGVSR
jgi:membrane-associated phospholipid phosphatase